MKPDNFGNVAAGYDAWRTRSKPEASVISLNEEEARERKWWDFESACRDFAASEPDGFAAVLRAVSRAMQDQKATIWR